MDGFSPGGIVQQQNFDFLDYNEMPHLLIVLPVCYGNSSCVRHNHVLDINLAMRTGASFEGFAPDMMPMYGGWFWLILLCRVDASW